MISVTEICDFRGFFLKKAYTFVFLLFLFSDSVFGQSGVTISSNGDEGPIFSQQQTIPLSFEFDELISGFEETDISTNNGTLSDFFVEWPEFGYEKNLGRLREFRIKIEDNPNTESSENAIIAIDFNTSGRIYALTLYNGVIEFDSNGTPTNPNFILQDELNEPRDIAIYNDKLYVAESGENRIVVYNLANDSVTYLGEEDLDTPSGLAIDDNGNIYIADTGNNRVAIYSSTGIYLDEVSGSGEQSLSSPIRLDVDSNQNIFVNDIGNNRIQIFDNSGAYINTISNINGDDLNTPGSIVVDDYGFIYIADLGEVDLSLFLNIDEIEPLELLPLASSDFRIQVFKFDDLSETAKSIEDNNLNIPVDLAFKPCGYLAVNNSDASLKFGSGAFVEIIFDAKIYNHLPTTFTANLKIEEECLAAEVSIFENVGKNKDCNSIPVNGDIFNAVWDETKPIIQTCYQEDQIVEIGDRIPNYIDEGLVIFKDNCDTDLEYDQNPTPGTLISQTTTTVTLTVTDDAGNVSEACIFDLVVEEEETPPAANCKNFEVTLDSNGEASITAEQIYDGNEELELQIDKEKFTCANLGDNEVILTVTDPDTGLSDTCEAIITVVDQTAPVFANNCTDVNREVTITEGETYTIPDFSTEFTATDNCDDDLEYTQDPVAGTEITETTDIVVRVSDDSGRRKTCLFTVTVKIEEKEDTPPEFENCPDDFSVINDAGECGAVVEFDTPTVNGDNGSITATRTDESGLNSGDQFPVGTTTISYQADDGVNEPVTCSFDITVSDNEDPVILDCPEDITVKLNEGESIILDDYRDQIAIDDNCTNNFLPVQNPAPGTSLNDDQIVTLTVVDRAGNESEICSFTVEIELEEAYEFQCIGELTVKLGEDAINSPVTEIPTEDFITSDISNLDFELRVQQFTCEDIGTNPLIIKATDKDTGDEYACTVSVTVVDVGGPLIICPAGIQTREIPENGIFELPDFAEEYSISDNCASYEDLVFTQDPSPGTEYTEEGDYQIVLTATDPYNNTETCEVTYRFVNAPDTEVPEFTNCPDDILVNNDNGICGAVVNFEIPEATDDSGNVTVQRNDSSGFESGDIFPVGVTTISYVAIDETGNSANCSFNITVIDNENPQRECNSNINISIAEGDVYTLPDFRDDFASTDNCDNGLTVVQEPEPGTAISETTDVAVRVTDDAGNSKRCIFTVNITIVEENTLSLSCPESYDLVADESCNFVVPDFQESLNFTPSEAVIEQDIEAGTLITEDTEIGITASFNGETEECSILLDVRDNIPPSISCPEDLEITLAEGENFTLPDYSEALNASDNCGEVEIIQIPPKDSIIDEDIQITFVVSDSFGNSSSCNFEIDIVRENQLNISCPDDKVLAWDENCSLTLPDFRSEAEISNWDDLEIRQQPAPGTLITEENIMVTLSIENGENSDTCSFNIQIEDQDPPVLNLKDAELNLDSNSEAILNFSDIDNGSFDNCDPEVQYELSRSRFTCKDIGENMVQVTATDDNGNNTTGTVIITITDGLGICEEPLEEYEYIFIYPNPNTGSFKVATPRDETIERIEVFDHRGRFITAKDYEDSVTEYAMELGPLQEAVYVLKIVTNERTVTKRIVFKY